MCKVCDNFDFIFITYERTKNKTQVMILKRMWKFKWQSFLACRCLMCSLRLYPTHKYLHNRTSPARPTDERTAPDAKRKWQNSVQMNDFYPCDDSEKLRPICMHGWSSRRRSHGHDDTDSSASAFATTPSSPTKRTHSKMKYRRSVPTGGGWLLLVRNRELES